MSLNVFNAFYMSNESEADAVAWLLANGAEMWPFGWYYRMPWGEEIRLGYAADEAVDRLAGLLDILSAEGAAVADDALAVPLD